MQEETFDFYAARVSEKTIIVDFAALILGLVLYYIRPQEWIMAIQPLKPVTLVMALAVIGVAARTGLSWRQLFKTPHDWLVLAYCFWMVAASPDRSSTFQEVYPLLLFYIVAVQALINLKRMTQYLAIWTGMIFAIAALGVLGLYGFDVLGAEDRTSYFKGRLTISTSIFNNPNSYGHSVVPAVLMIYFLCVWRRPIFVRIGSLPLFAVPLYCIYLTLSKGAFLSAFATAVAAFTFGRPKIVQILILAFALTSGWAAVKTLPRMEEINSSKTDEAIQGRVHAFTYGFETLQKSYTGVGKGTFFENIQSDTGYGKSSHSSYVQIGAELGKVGFFLFLAILYSSLRTLITSKSRNDGEERVRRILFTMLISYMISSWMVDFAYRVAFFLCIGGIAAYHRLLLQKESEELAEERPYSAVPELTISGAGPVPVKAVPAMMSPTTARREYRGSSTSVDEKPSEVAEETSPGGIKWNRLGLIDLALVAVMFYVTIKIWDYAIDSM